jgi:hypothetical protein
MKTNRNTLTTMPNQTNQIAFADNTALARNKTPPLRITKRVKDAINAMVVDKQRWDDAAIAVGLSTRAMRLALEKPHVIQYLRKQLDVSRGARAVANFHRLCEIADCENNMPAVNAIKALEQISDEPTNKTQQPSAGVTIRIVNVATQPQHEPTNKIPTTYLETETTNEINDQHVIKDNMRD